MTKFNTLSALSLAMALMLPANAMAQEVFGNADGCAAYTSGDLSGVPVYWAQGDHFRFGSNRCEIDALVPLEQGVQRASLTCTGIGGTSGMQFDIFETEDPDVFHAHITGIPRSRQGLRRCQ